MKCRIINKEIGHRQTTMVTRSKVGKYHRVDNCVKRKFRYKKEKLTIVWHPGLFQGKGEPKNRKGGKTEAKEDD